MSGEDLAVRCLVSARDFWRTAYIEDVCPDPESLAALDRAAIPAALRINPSHPLWRSGWAVAVGLRPDLEKCSAKESDGHLA